MMLETNIDDMNPEIYSYLFPKLFEQGALDVYLTNIIMKKNRPGMKVNVLCDQAQCHKFEEILFKETTTLGIRKYPVDREKLDREFIGFETKFGKVTIKVAFKEGKILKYSPEYEECKRIAREFNISIKEVYEELLAEFREYKA